MPSLTPYQTARAIEEASLNGWPALEQILYDGWILRFAQGYSRRNNSVNALYTGERFTARDKIALCEAAYKARGLPPTFRLTPFVQPFQLDGLLAQAGYERVSPTSVQVISPAERPAPPAPATARQWALPSEGWFAAYVRMNQVPVLKQDALRRILGHIPLECCYLGLWQGEQAVACGLAVHEGPYVGLFDIVTDPARRRQGLGQALVEHLLHWAAQRGAKLAYLQVVAGNEPALGLYAKLGFREIYQYWYRIKPAVGER